MTVDAFVGFVGAGALLAIAGVAVGLLITRRSGREPEERRKLAFFVPLTVVIVGGVAIALVSSAFR